MDNVLTFFVLSIAGQTGSGKSYTMMGYGEMGLIPRICSGIFDRAKQEREKVLVTPTRSYARCCSHTCTVDYFVPSPSQLLSDRKTLCNTHTHAHTHTHTHTHTHIYSHTSHTRASPATKYIHACINKTPSNVESRAYLNTITTSRWCCRVYLTNFDVVFCKTQR